jgi:hypothetical protein
MTLALRLLPALLLATLPVALAAQPAHGAGYTMLTITDSGGRKSSMSMQVELLDGKFRTGMKGDLTASGPFEFYQIIDSVAGTVTQVMPAQSMAMIMSRSTVKVPTQPPYTIELGANPTSDLLDLGAGESILGHATRHYRQTVAYTMKFTIGGETCTKPSRQVSDFWTTNEVTLPDFTAAIQRFTGVAVPAGLEQKLDSIWHKATKGAELRRIGTVTSTTAAGDTLRVVTTKEMTALNPDSVDAHDFEVPPGYNVMDMRDTMANMDPGVLEEAMLKMQVTMADKLKKTLCGGSGS